MTDTCPEPDCGGVIRKEGDERVCQECGLVTGDVHTASPDRISSVSQSFHLSDVSRADRGLTSSISLWNFDANDTELSSSQKSRMARLRKRQRESFDRDDDRLLNYGLGEVARMRSALGYGSDFEAVASVIYRKAYTAGLAQGRGVDTLSAAAVMAAARHQERPLTFADVAQVSRVMDAYEHPVETRINRTYTKIERSDAVSFKSNVPDPTTYISRICSEVDATNGQERLARELTKETMGRGLHSGCSPAGIAAACIYIAGILSGPKISQQPIADAATVTTVTIRNQYQRLLEEGVAEAVVSPA